MASDFIFYTLFDISNISAENVSQLRELSRQQYLVKREEKELKLLEQSLQDDQYLFEGVRLSKDEEERNELNKSILGMVQDKYRFDYNDTGQTKLSHIVLYNCYFLFPYFNSDI